MRPEAPEPGPHRQAGRHVHHRQDRAGGEHAAVGVADQRSLIGELQLYPIGAVRVIAELQQAAMPAHAMADEALRIERRQGLGRHCARDVLQCSTGASALVDAPKECGGGHPAILHRINSSTVPLRA